MLDLVHDLHVRENDKTAEKLKLTTYTFILLYSKLKNLNFNHKTDN